MPPLLAKDGRVLFPHRSKGLDFAAFQAVGQLGVGGRALIHVEGKEGPLYAGELERARQFAGLILERAKSSERADIKKRLWAR